MILKVDRSPGIQWVAPLLVYFSEFYFWQVRSQFAVSALARSSKVNDLTKLRLRGGWLKDFT
jgi:hypothetical protein